MSAPSRTQAEQALAALVAAIRPDWDRPGILAILRRRPDRPLDQLAAAALWAATRTDQTTPALIDTDDGDAYDRIRGRHVDRTPVPGRDRCPYHPDQPRTSCEPCADHARAATRANTAGHLATIRQAIRDTHTEECADA